MATKLTKPIAREIEIAGEPFTLIVDGRDAVLIELNPEYAAIAEKRLHADAGMFAKVAND